MSELAAIRLAYETGADRKIKGLNTEIGYSQWEIRAPFFYKESEIGNLHLVLVINPLIWM